MTRFAVVLTLTFLTTFLATSLTGCVKKPSAVVTSFKNDDGKVIAVLDKTGSCFVAGEKGGLFPADSSICDRLPSK